MQSDTHGSGPAAATTTSPTATAAEIHVRGNGTARATPPVAASVAVVVVTWNRKGDVTNALEAIARQSYPRERMDVIVVDNASADGTLEHLTERFRPEAVVHNPTERAHEPNFQPPSRPFPDASNKAGFRSLTIVRNTNNLGGCGGFNTGFGYIAHAFASRPPDYVWLADDDAGFPEDALAQLVGAARTDPKIGIVGSRTVNIADRSTTIETTIYLDRKTGAMCDEPPSHHPLYQSHREWVARTGGTKGKREFSGLRDVDVVSACSMLARWSAVEKVGFWDWRYFIYCDDADWCLRMAKAGYRVVLNLDAVVYHTPWLMKLTPARIYYAQRNAVWMVQKILPRRELRAVTLRWMKTILRDSLRAGLHRRLFHAEIIRTTARDIAIGRSGKTASDGPPAMPVMDALRRAGCLRASARVALLCALGDRGDESLKWAADLRAHVRENLAAGEAEPRWLEVVRNDVLAAERSPAAGPTPERIVYGGHMRSRIRRQFDLLRRPPTAVVVFDQTNDFPAIRGRWNIHIDTRKPTAAQLERDGPLPRAAFLARWAVTAVRCVLYALRVRPYTSATRYG